MIIRKKIILIFTGVILILMLVILFLPNVVSGWRWQKAVEASSGFPYQIGLTKVVITPCIPTVPPALPVCNPTTIPPLPPLLCGFRDFATCAGYSLVSGVPAGGMGSSALFSNIAIAKAGLTPGGQLIAGGMSPVLMDSGVLASAGGCFGCVAKNNFIDKTLNWADKYIIAGFK